MNFISFQSPLGQISLFADSGGAGGAIVALDWGHGAGADGAHPTPLLKEASRQLNAYFAGKLRRFDLPLRPAGTDFQKSVWRLMQEIPFGQTRTYGDLAGDLGSAPRAVGGACGRNPIAIIIPCHRIVASGARIGGFTAVGGKNSKRHLLRLEGVAGLAA